MVMIYRAVQLWTILLCLAPLSLAHPSGGGADIRSDLKQTSSRGILYSAEIEGHTFKEGDPIQLTLYFDNPTKHAVTIWLSGFWPNHRVLVTDESGNKVPLTEGGEERFAAFAPGGARNKNIPRILAPGERYIDYKGLDMTALYRMSKGRYKAQVVYHDLQGPTPIRVVTKAIEFEVE